MSDASEREALREHIRCTVPAMPVHIAERIAESLVSWLAAHDRAVERRGEVKALREAADDMDDTDDPDAIYVDNGDIDLWLRASADRIESEGGEGR